MTIASLVAGDLLVVLASRPRWVPWLGLGSVEEYGCRALIDILTDVIRSFQQFFGEFDELYSIVDD